MSQSDTQFPGNSAAPQAESGLASSALFVAAMPPLFVFLWATGFVFTKLGMPYVEPMTFLVLRFVLVISLMLPIALLWRARWPHSWPAALHIVASGALIHGGYLGGVFSAIHAGMSAGVIALVCGLQPILTAFAAAPILGERLSRRQWAGLLLGLLGVALVLQRRMSLDGLSLTSIAAALVALGSITSGTVYQKRFCPNFDLRSGAVLQFIGALCLVTPLALLNETRQVQWTGELVLALVWLVVALSIGAIALLTLLIRRGAVTKVASLIYLVPPTTAVLAWLMFGETFTGLALLGMAFTVLGVALVVTRQPVPAASSAATPAATPAAILAASASPAPHRDA
jgi:drug/metabolite transporter (DMT)-like permease